VKIGSFLSLSDLSGKSKMNENVFDLATIDYLRQPAAESLVYDRVNLGEEGWNGQQGMCCVSSGL